MQEYKIAIKVRGEHSDGTELTKPERLGIAQEVQKMLADSPEWQDELIEAGSDHLDLFFPGGWEELEDGSGIVPVLADGFSDGVELHIDIAVIGAA